MPELPRPLMFVLHFQWTEHGTAQDETFGPWTAAEDDSHIEQITAFVRDWPLATGCAADSVTMIALLDPAAWLAERRS